MLHQIVKPFGVPVEAAFRRIEVMAKYLEFFPPPTSRGKSANQEQWEEFNAIKKMSESDKREMKYNLLPDSYHDRFDNNENDWTKMSPSKFLAKAQKFELADMKEREKMEQQREKLKRKQPHENDSISNLSRNQRDKNVSKKRQKSEHKPANLVAKMCELCKTADKPAFIYTTHNSDTCKFRESYAKAMNGNNSPRREKPSKEHRRKEKDFRREIKILQNQVKKLSNRSKKRGRKDGSSSVSSMESDNASY